MLVVVGKNLNVAVVMVNRMIIILRRIPDNTQKHEVASYLNPVLKGGILQKSGQIELIKIQIIKDTRTNSLEYHALVTIDSDAAAERVIKKLNGKAFKGKHIAVREYVYRSWHNDPRIKSDGENTEQYEKRQTDRRRNKLEVVVKKTSIKFRGDEQFHRTL